VEQVTVPVKKSEPTNPTPTTSPALLMPKPVVFDVARRKIDRGERTVPQNIGMALGFPFKRVCPHNISTSVNPGRIGETRAGHIKGCEDTFA